VGGGSAGEKAEKKGRSRKEYANYCGENQALVVAKRVLGALGEEGETTAVPRKKRKIKKVKKKKIQFLYSRKDWLQGRKLIRAVNGTEV